MVQPLVSVIVPVYNVEKYLRECLESILQQSYKEIELIAVDDGSTDESGRICDEYSKHEATRFRVIHQENMGVVSARSNGILRAQGEYACFVDADDSIDVRMVEHLVRVIGSADIATCGIICEKRDGAVLTLRDAFPEGMYSSQEEMNEIFANMIRFHEEHREGVLPYSISKLYRTSMLKDIVKSLDSRITYGEDRELVYKYMMKAKSICISYAPMYYYRYRTGSALHSANHHVLHDINYLYEALYKAFSDNARADVLLPQLEMLMLSRICMSPGYMGFSPRFNTIRYLFPYYNFFHDDKVVLYGAGVVGWNYYHQTKHLKDINYVLWVDKNYHSDGIQEVKNILGLQYDYILIAVLEQNLAEKIREELKDMNVEVEKILWKKPIILYDF